MGEIVIHSDHSPSESSQLGGLLSTIRPAWQAKSLITRVRRLVEVDPSSACQRLFNAATHDLREKVVIAGIDIAREAAKAHKLPPIEKAEDVENYSVANLIDLAYRIGLLTRPEWRRLSRCYEIRRDLEHEDDEYEAGLEDCIYIFKTCIEVVLAKDPAHLLRVQDVKTLVEQPTAVLPSESFLADYAQAPQPRQEEISKFLTSIALDKTQSDIVQLGFETPRHTRSRKCMAARTLRARLSERVYVGGNRRLVRVQPRWCTSFGVSIFSAFRSLRCSAVTSVVCSTCPPPPE
jgi:hypothetical protein